MLGPSPLLLSRFFFQSTSPAGIYTLSLHDALPISLAPWLDTITRVLGVVVILMGLAFIGKVPFLQRERRLPVSPRAGLAGAPVLGVVFGLGWTDRKSVV